MNNETKNKIIELHLTGEYSQSKIAKQFSVAQSSVSKVITAYKNGEFIYNDLTVPEQSADIDLQPISECEQDIVPNIDITEPVIPATDEPTEQPVETTETISNNSDQLETAECEQDISPNIDITEPVIPATDESTEQPVETTETAECEEIESTTPSETEIQPIEFPPAIITEYELIPPQVNNSVASETLTQTENTAEYEQEIPATLLNKAKITFTNHGLWLNQFALKVLHNPNALAYSFDSENLNLYIEPITTTIVNPHYYCKAKCSKNYTKTANKQLINDLQEILELEFKDTVDINLNTDSFKIHFNFNFENGQFIINLPTMISKIDIDMDKRI